MATTPYVRVVIYGTIATSQTWSVGLSVRFDGAVTPTVAQMNTYASQVLADFMSQCFATTGTMTRSLYSLAVNVIGCRAYYYQAGDTVAVRQGLATQTPVAGTGSPVFPAQVSVVASLRTILPGAHYRGRIYLPLLNATVGNAVRLGTGVAAAVSAGVANWITQINTHSLNTTAGVVSVVGTGVGAPAPVSSVVVDDVADTQRNRRNKILPTTSIATAIVLP